MCLIRLLRLSRLIQIPRDLQIPVFLTLLSAAVAVPTRSVIATSPPASFFWRGGEARGGVASNNRQFRRSCPNFFCRRGSTISAAAVASGDSSNPFLDRMWPRRLNSLTSCNMSSMCYKQSTSSQPQRGLSTTASSPTNEVTAAAAADGSLADEVTALKSNCNDDMSCGDDATPTAATGVDGVALLSSYGDFFERKKADSDEIDETMAAATYDKQTGEKISPSVHYVFLVHGWLGNDLEMSYLSNAMKSIIDPSNESGSGGDDERNSEGVESGVVQSKLEPSPTKRQSEIAQTMAVAADYQGDMVGESLAAGDVGKNEGEQCHDDNVVNTISSATENPGGDGAANIVVHSATCNIKRTKDGIKMGGTRLADEVVDFIRADMLERRRRRQSNPLGDETKDAEGDVDAEHVSLSFVGNSLGGMYARYATSLLPHRITLRTGSADANLAALTCYIHPNVFCTTATPHLGVASHTYLPIPRFAEQVIGTGMRQTGRDLFRLATDGECVVRSMCTEDKFLNPLGAFRSRLAYANAFGTDFQVPTETAAFLNKKSAVPHVLVEARRRVGSGESTDGDDGGKEAEAVAEEVCLPSFIAAVFRTNRQERPSWQSGGDAGWRPGQRSREDASLLCHMSESLDSLGWTKVFIDVRDRIPLPGMAKPSWMMPSARGSLDELIVERSRAASPSTSDDNKEETLNDGDNDREGATNVVFESRELSASTFAGDTINIPLGHTVMVANSKSEGYSKLNSQGRPVMDKLASDIVRDILNF